jgi:hypothetical protein
MQQALRLNAIARWIYIGIYVVVLAATVMT